MALATQCPHCYTSFRVANDQLKLHAGMVRCGACKQTFNGIEHLLAPGATAKTPPSAIQTPSNMPTAEEEKASEAITAEVVTENADVHVQLASQKTQQNTPQNTDEAAPEIKHEDSSLSINSELGSEFISKVSSEFSVESNSEKTKLPETKQAAAAPDTTSTVVKPKEDEDSFADEGSADNIDADQISDDQQSELSATPIAIEANATPNSVDQASDTLAPTDENTKQISDDDLAEFSNNDADRIIQTENIPAAATVVIADPQLSDSDVSPNVPTASSPVSTPELAQKSHPEPTLTSPSNSEQEPQAESKPVVQPKNKRPASLTASLDFELSKEDREWVDELAHIHQLELETRAAVLDEASNDWSKHETPTIQDGFIDSLKDLKPILDDISADSTASDLPTTKTKHQTLNDLRVSGGKEKVSDSLADQEDSLNDTVIHDPEVTPAFVLQAERAQRFGKWKRYGLGFGVFLFTMLGLAQSAYFLRSDIAAQVPQLKPQLLSICKVLSCQIKLPAQKSLLEITGSELLIVNEELSMNTLSVQIQNKSSTVQAWPHFDLTLKDRRGKDLLQKAFSPTQYLDNKDLLNKGMAANSESNHKIFFQLNGLKASDYTVEIFYP